MTTTSPNLILSPSSKPLPWWLNVITALLICLFISLSYWQLDRGLQKKAVISNVQQSAQTISGSQLVQDSANTPYKLGQPVTLQGKFDSEHFFLIENKFYEGTIGFHVITPFYLNDNFAVLVNQGWISRETTLDSNFLVAPASQTITISGQLYKPKHNIFIRSNTIKASWPQQALEVDLLAFEQRLGHSLYPMVVNMDHDSPYSFAGPYPLDFGMTPEKHYGYSAQWLIFALILGGIWFYYRFRSNP